MEYRNKIIIALDLNDIVKAKKLVETLYPRVKFFKIGLEMINTGQAPELIKYINKLGGKVFYDVKLNDIPNTIGRTVKVISGLGVEMFTIHASAGADSVKAAVKNRGQSKVVGVTVLTSLSGSETKNKVIKFAKMLKQEGVYGIVCSPHEALLIKKIGLKIITPGIRPIWADKNDQKRISTPIAAIKAGSDYLVIGRPITSPPKAIGLPRKALERIIKEIS